MNFYDILFARKMANQGDITTEGLSVTENGTYTAPTGKAYTPVVVNVQGYAKKSIANTPTPIATFNASALPMPSLTIGIEAVQAGNGDPSPTNVRPISGWSAVNVVDTKKNLFDKTQTFTKDKYIDINGNIQSTTYGWEISDYIPLKNNTNYFISGNNVTGASACNALYDKDKNFVRTFNYPIGEHNGAFSTNANEYYIRICTQESVVDNVQIEEGTTASTYEAYSGTTYTIQLGDIYYGCTLDVVSGVLTVTLGKIIVDENTNVKAYGGWRFYFDVPNFVSPANNVVANIICDKLSTRAKISMPQGNSISAYDKSGARMIISVSDTITTVEDMNAWLSNNPITIVYELATPITIQLTPTAVKSLLGTNNIWADTGDVQSGEYLEAL